MYVTAVSEKNYSLISSNACVIISLRGVLVFYTSVRDVI